MCTPSIAVTPKELIFHGPFDKAVVLEVEIANRSSDKAKAFKLRSNAPRANLFVSTVCGVVSPMMSINVKITLRAMTDEAKQISRSRHRVVVMLVDVQDAETPPTKETWKSKDVKTVTIPVKYVRKETPAETKARRVKDKEGAKKHAEEREEADNLQDELRECEDEMKKIDSKPCTHTSNGETTDDELMCETCLGQRDKARTICDEKRKVWHATAYMMGKKDEPDESRSDATISEHDSTAKN